MTSSSTSSPELVPPTAKDEALLRKSWFEYLRSSSSDDEYSQDCQHIFGFDQEDEDGFTLSMLQRITSQRILDYNLRENKADTTDKLQTSFQCFTESHGPIVNLKNRIQAQSPSMCLAAEFKRASPSKGQISQPGMTAGSQASTYYTAGASVISILTEERWFKGSLRDLTEARLETSTPENTTATGRPRPVILRKDFIVSEYLILEAAAAGADTVLLIVAVTPAALLTRLIAYCRSLGIEPLVEVHAPAELDVAVRSGAKVIGVNNRNLHTFHMDPATTDRTADELQRLGLTFRHEDAGSSDNKIGDYALCSLSGMSTAQDVHRYRECGVGMVLIGESLMRAADPRGAIEALLLNPEDYHSNNQQLSQAGGGAYIGGTQLVKICGITNPEDATVACRAGANLIGVIFADKSKRKVTSLEAKAVVDAVRLFGERTARVDLSTNSSSSSTVATLAQKARTLQSCATARRPLVVGVFQNQTSEFIAQAVAESGIDLVQLHGNEGMEAAKPERCGGVPALRVVDIPVDLNNRDAVVEEILTQLTGDPVAVLLDTTVRGGGGGGGTGKTFDWGIAEAVQSRGLPVIIAGGLTPNNVKDAVAGVRPWGVDVSSGTEQSPGKKDVEKVERFVRAVRMASKEAGKGF